MEREARKRLHDALAACKLIAKFTAGRTLAEYEADPMLSAAVERKFEVIGMRNRIIHGYDAVDSETIWSVVTVHIPRLTEQLEAALG